MGDEPPLSFFNRGKDRRQVGRHARTLANFLSPDGAVTGDDFAAMTCRPNLAASRSTPRAIIRVFPHNTTFLQSQMSTDYCPVYSPFFSVLGVACAMVFTSIGASYGTAKSSIGISATSVMRPDLMVRCCIPVVMSGIIAIYGLVVSVVVSDSLTPKMPLFTGVVHLGAGLSVGLSGLAAGFAIGIAGEAGVRGAAVQPRLFVGMMLILIFAEVLGIYGLIVALILNNKGTVKDVDALCPGSFGTGLGAGVVNNQW